MTQHDSGNPRQDEGLPGKGDKIHPASLPVEKLLADCKFERTKRGGPGGQHRNKTESAIVVTHTPTGVIGQASERRSQHRNRDEAITRLRLNLALAIRVERDPVIERSDKRDHVSQLWVSRTRGGKIQVSDQHADHPAVVAESLDWLAACGFEIPAAAQILGVSNSQLVKFLKSVSPAWELVQRQRVALGLHRLK